MQGRLQQGVTNLPRQQDYLERPMGSEHSTEVIQSHGYEHDPGGPLRYEGEGVGCYHPCHHQVPLLHQDGSRAEEERDHPYHLMHNHTKWSIGHDWPNDLEIHEHRLAMPLSKLRFAMFASLV